MARAGNIAKKLTVLGVISENKDILFSDVANKKDIEEAWKEVLVEAQSVGLAGDSRKWNFAKNLFETWKADTLAKVEGDSKASKRSPTKLNDVDKLIIDILETESDAPMEFEVPPVLEIKPSPSSSKGTTSRTRRTKIIETAMEVSEPKFNLSPAKDEISRKRRTICSANNLPNIKRIHFTISPETSSYQIRENYVETKNPASPVKKFKQLTNDSFTQTNNVRKSTGINFKTMNPPTKLKVAKRLEYDLSEVDDYLRRLQIVKLEKDLQLENVEFTDKTLNEDIEMYYRRLQILKLETELDLPQSKYTEDFVE